MIQLLLMLVVLVIGPVVPAQAACADPAAAAGKVIFNADHSAVQYCNGDAWWRFPKAGPWMRVATYDHLSFDDVVFGEGLFVAAVNSGGADGGIWSSPDGITWTQRLSLGVPMESIAYGNGRFVAVQGWWDYASATSDDGINWNYHSNAMPSFDAWETVGYGNGYFISTSWGSTDYIARSTDGINWEQITLPITAHYGGGRCSLRQRHIRSHQR